MNLKIGGYTYLVHHGTKEMILLKIFQYMWKYEKNPNAKCYEILNEACKKVLS